MVLFAAAKLANISHKIAKTRLKCLFCPYYCFFCYQYYHSLVHRGSYFEKENNFSLGFSLSLHYLCTRFRNQLN